MNHSNDYYEGMLDGTNKCCRIMSLLLDAIITKSNIDTKLFVARTAETMAKVSETIEQHLNNKEKEN